MPRPASPPYGKRVLELGMDGLDVWHLQIKLIGWGSGSDRDGIGVTMDPVIVTGQYDTTTADAVRRFQEAHGLTITGACDAATFRAIDREQADHPVFLDTLKCPCAAGKNGGAIPCRCNDHAAPGGACGGFGANSFAGQFTHADSLDLYDKREYPGMDRAVIWAVRALMHRASLADIQVVAGYQCWFDNFHATDDTRWTHRTSTLHMGKTIEIRHRGACVGSPCGDCDRIRGVALAKCGFQLRFHEPQRVAVAEGALSARPPSTPYSVLVSTVRRKEKEDDDFIQTDADGLAPLYEGKAGFTFPVEVTGGAGRDPKRAPSADVFENIETKAGGSFPLGAGRLWHGGVHLHVNAGTEVHALTDGEIVGCRVGEAEQAKDHGSRNFVLIRHRRGNDAYHSLYMHLDDETARADAAVRWRKQLALRAKDHVEALVPSPIYKHIPAAGLAAPSRLDAGGHGTGLAKGEHVEVTGVAVNPKTALDTTLPAGCEVYKLAAQSNDGKDQYVFTKRATVDVGKHRAADATLQDKIDKHEVIGLKEPIPVRGGERIGKVAAAPKGGGLGFAKSYMHLEVFAEKNLLDAPDFPDYTLIDASAEAKVADRKAVAKALVKAKLLSEVPDKVLSEDDVLDLALDPGVGRLRSAVVKMPSAWALDWEKALSDSTTFGFMKDQERDDLGKAFNDYRFWKEVDDADPGKLLPGSSVVHHFHPIALLLAFAYKPET